MSKLVYPNNGLYPRCKVNTTRCTELLSSAISDCAFDIPSDFPQKSYLAGLSNTLSGYRNESSSIDQMIKSIDNSYVNLSDSLSSSEKRLSATKIIKRTRMVV